MPKQKLKKIMFFGDLKKLRCMKNGSKKPTNKLIQQKKKTNEPMKSLKKQTANQNKVRVSIVNSRGHDNPPKWVHHPISKRISTICETTQWIE
jgi:hypothetical protein